MLYTGGVCYEIHVAHVFSLDVVFILERDHRLIGVGEGVGGGEHHSREVGDVVTTLHTWWDIERS